MTLEVTNTGIDLTRSAVARYLQLASLYRRRIDSGEWPVGKQIPILEDLIREAGVAPATVSKALKTLVEEGLLARYRAKGTYVLRSPAKSLWQEIETDSKGFLKPRKGALVTLVAQSEVDRPPSQPHPGPLAPSYRWMRRVYWRNDQPFLFSELYVASDLAARLRPSDLTKTAQDMLGTRVVGTRQTLTITAADLEAAAFLEIALNSPVARIDRTRYDADGVIISISYGVYRADVIRLDFIDGEVG